jgi:hypothetical protein
MGAATMREKNGRRKMREKSFIFAYIIGLDTSTSQLNRNEILR